MPADPKDTATDLPPGVPRPPSKADIDQVSEDQAMITDEWAPAPPHPEGSAEGKA